MVWNPKPSGEGVSATARNGPFLGESCRLSSVAEQQFCKLRVVGSIPTAGYFCFAAPRGCSLNAASLLGHILQYAPSRRLALGVAPHRRGFAKKRVFALPRRADARSTRRRCSVTYFSMLPRVALPWASPRIAAALQKGVCLLCRAARMLAQRGVVARSHTSVCSLA